MKTSKTDPKNFRIGHRSVGKGQPCLIIGEVAQSHDGSLGLAHSFIDAIADTGADGVKFQTHIASAESTRGEKFRVKFSYEDETRYDYWKRMEFTAEQWQGLKDHAARRKLLFLSSPFSLEAVELLEKIGVPAWKIASGEVNNPILFKAMTDTRKPILLSSGMSGWAELDRAVQLVRKTRCDLAVFQCTSKYPTPLQEVGLNNLDEMSRRYRVPVGLSDHTGSIFPSLGAMAGVASLIEIHVAFHPTMFGPDVPVSVTLDQLKLLADAREAFHTLKTHPTDKDQMARDLKPLRSLFNKSVALKKDLPASTVLKLEMLTTKKPATGIPAQDLKKCIGKKLKHAVSAQDVLTWKDLSR